MDTLTPLERSERMALVRSKDTAPEMTVRRLVHSLGYRYRLHVKDLPGSPDIVFPARNRIVFVHGCFWHRHCNCPNSRWPKSRLAFWGPKLEANRKRDRRNLATLRLMGWQCLVVWECQLKEKGKLTEKIRRFMESEK